MLQSLNSMMETMLCAYLFDSDNLIEIEVVTKTRSCLAETSEDGVHV